MSVPPLDRIADAFIDHGPPDRARERSTRTTISSPSWRQRAAQAVSALGVEEARKSQLFTRIAELGNEFEAGLLALLFDDPELRRWGRDYLMF